MSINIHYYRKLYQVFLQELGVYIIYNDLLDDYIRVLNIIKKDVQDVALTIEPSRRKTDDNYQELSKIYHNLDILEDKLKNMDISIKTRETKYIYENNRPIEPL